MAQRVKQGRPTGSGRRRKTVAGKHGTAPKTRAGTHPSDVDLQTQLDLRTRELREALDQRAATADVLKVISQSTFDLQTVLDLLVESAAQLCDANNASVYPVEGNLLRHVANCDGILTLKLGQTVPITNRSLSGIAATKGCIVHIHDALARADEVID